MWREIENLGIRDSQVFLCHGLICDGHRLWSTCLSRTWGKVLCTLHGVQGYLAHKKQPPPPWDHLRTLDIVLRWAPRRGLFLCKRGTHEYERRWISHTCAFPAAVNTVHSRDTEITWVITWVLNSNLSVHCRCITRKFNNKPSQPPHTECERLY